MGAPTGWNSIAGNPTAVSDVLMELGLRIPILDFQQSRASRDQHFSF